MKLSCDIAVIGAGPAGAAAAIQAARQGFSVILFEKNEIGGSARCANRIENLPGIPRGIGGLSFSRKLALQLSAHRVRLIKKEVTEIGRNKSCFEILAGGKYFRSRAAIVASGLEGCCLNVPGEKDLAEFIASYPVPQKIPHSGKRILVIGGGDTAFDQALNFSRKAASVTVAMRGMRPGAIPRLLTEAQMKGVRIRKGHRPCEVRRAGKAIAVIFSVKNQTRVIEADFVSLCTGKIKHKTRMLAGNIKKDPGLIFAGDCEGKKARHIAVAAGDGIAKAMAVADYLSKM